MSSQNSNPFWFGDWKGSQDQYLEAWTTFLKLMTNVIPDMEKSKKKNPMDGNMESWWNLVAPSLPEGSYEFINKMLEQGRFFNLLGEQFTQLLANINDLNRISSDWQKTLDEQIEELKKIYTRNNHDTREAMHSMLGAWQLLPMDTLQRTFSASSFMPGDFLEDIKPDVLGKVTDKFLSIPGVGYSRESQEQIQEGFRLWNVYQKTYIEFNNAMNRVGINALDAMRKKIIEMANTGKEFKSLREIYDLWIDCNEEAYASYVYTDEYSELYGKLTNSLMAVKHHGRNYIDEILGALNMPTRRGMNTMQKRQQEMRREHKETMKIIKGLQDEVQVLHGKISGKTGFKKNQGNQPVPEKSVDKTEVSKKNTRKKSVKKQDTGKKSKREPVAKKKAKKTDTIVIKI